MNWTQMCLKVRVCVWVCERERERERDETEQLKNHINCECCVKIHHKAVTQKKSLSGFLAFYVIASWHIYSFYMQANNSHSKNLSDLIQNLQIFAQIVEIFFCKNSLKWKSYISGIFNKFKHANKLGFFKVTAFSLVSSKNWVYFGF